MSSPRLSVRKVLQLGKRFVFSLRIGFDDPAKVAVYAFLREYEGKEINVRGQKMAVDP